MVTACHRPRRARVTVATRTAAEALAWISSAVDRTNPEPFEQDSVSDPRLGFKISHLRTIPGLYREVVFSRRLAVRLQLRMLNVRL